MYNLQLRTLSEKARPWTSSRAGFPSKSGGDSGDMVLFNALLTFAGVPEAAGGKDASAYIPLCIALDGRPVRSPDLVDLPPERDGFSKDMLLGVLLWTLVTRNPAPLERLIGYVNKTGCLCPSASDRRCTLTPQMKYLTNAVSKHVGSNARLKGAWLPGWLFAALEIASALVTPLGYQCHLLSVKALICRLLGQSSGVPEILWPIRTAVSRVVPEILARRDSGNPWFLYLAGDKDRAALTLLSMNVQPGRGHQWAWERDSAEKAWHDSMGWDLLFITNLLMDEKGPQ